MKCIKIYLFIIFGISTVATFVWNDCGSATELVRITSLDLYSNKTHMYVTGKGKVAENITGPILGRIQMQKKFFWGWTAIPCVDNIGSCTYNDICELSPYIDKPCPSEFEANDLPCKCPILQGQYMAKKFPVDTSIFPHWIEKGKYRIQITLYKSETEMMCLLMYITL